MTIGKLIEIFQFYEEYFTLILHPPIFPIRMGEEDRERIPNTIRSLVLLQHLCWMVKHTLVILQNETPLSSSAIQKAMRWLGYIQGELRAAGHFSINQLRDHSRTDAKVVEGE